MKISRKSIIDDRSAIGHFILSAITEVRPEVYETIDRGDDEFEVCMTFNGVEIPIDVVINKWVERNRQGINKAAVNLIAEKLDELHVKILQAEQEIQEKLSDLKSDIAESFNLQYNSWDDYFYENDDHA
ncbi:hypothetical protein b23_0221 [Synechococcus phage B23]|nr:hypothetical protein b23_0221 [Synechococcus phage B23]